ncbi:interferon-induced transmembrane protein 1 [Nerophis ophidion]|uniref:interferon-induced transmembrane protein 1 n=1 Tax=Nerophis ophidion TaxID=159077 RepID=UPI002ADF3E1C|nr:interferon-induced transmembrane protein 1 [Nerophis ophidion]
MSAPLHATPMLPIGSTEAQYTMVEIAREKPRDYIFYSLISFVHLGNPCCLGLVALYYSIKARDRKVAGDIEGTKANGILARNLNIVATVIFCILVLVFIIVVSVSLTRPHSYEFSSNYRNRRD